MTAPAALSLLNRKVGHLAVRLSRRPEGVRPPLRVSLGTLFANFPLLEKIRGTFNRCSSRFVHSRNPDTIPEGRMRQSAAALCGALTAVLFLSAHGRVLLVDDGKRQHLGLQPRLIAGAGWRQSDRRMCLHPGCRSAAGCCIESWHRACLFLKALPQCSALGGLANDLGDVAVLPGRHRHSLSDGMRFPP